jgi:DNA-directed RNA polymerase specialized sigma subunit
MRTLTPRRIQIIKLYHEQGMTMEEIGKLYGLTRQRIQQLVSKYSNLVGYEYPPEKNLSK